MILGQVKLIVHRVDDVTTVMLMDGGDNPTFSFTSDVFLTTQDAGEHVVNTLGSSVARALADVFERVNR